MAAYFPWWLGAVSLAAVALGFWRVFGRLLGVSGSMQKALEPLDALAADRAVQQLQADEAATTRAMIEATRRQFGDAAAQAAEAETGGSGPAHATRFTYGSNVMLLAGVTLGGLIGGLSHGAFGVTFSFGPVFERLLASGWAVVPVLLGGGFLVGFGTAMAGGCTSGHGLCGTSRLQKGSVLATCAFFGTGIAVSFLLVAVAR